MPVAQMTELYDLKGSSVNRKVKKGVVLKDRNFIENRGGEKRQRNLVYSGGHYGGLLVSPAHQEKLMKQLALDTDLLRQHSIMDYSLLLGISEPQGTHTYTYQEQARQRKAHNDGLGTGFVFGSFGVRHCCCSGFPRTSVLPVRAQATACTSSNAFVPRAVDVTTRRGIWWTHKRNVLGWHYRYIAKVRCQ